jgi:diguanylate cyclase (GGDEF)-like protein
MDIDHFKQYNDTYGHQEGDNVLKQVAIALTNSLYRTEDLIFRLGGEEFGLIYKVKNKNEAIKIASRAKDNIEALGIEHTGNSAASVVTMSMGLYVVNLDDYTSEDEIYKKCDDMLYISKENGRNKITAI